MPSVSSVSGAGPAKSAAGGSHVVLQFEGGCNCAILCDRTHSILCASLLTVLHPALYARDSLRNGLMHQTQGCHTQQQPAGQCNAMHLWHAATNICQTESFADPAETAEPAAGVSGRIGSPAPAVENYKPTRSLLPRGEGGGLPMPVCRSCLTM